MSTEMMAQTIEEKMDKLIDSVNEMNITLKLNGKQLEQIPDLDNRVTVLERNESRNEGGISSIKTLCTVFSALVISAVGWLYHTTYNNNNDVLLLLQRVGNLEQIIQQDKSHAVNKWSEAMVQAVEYPD